MANLTADDYSFDTTTLNAGVVVDALNGYKGDNIWQDVIYQFDFEVTEVGDWAFSFEDEDADTVKMFYVESSKDWNYGVN